MGNEGNIRPINPKNAAFIGRLRTIASPTPVVIEPSITPKNPDAPDRERAIKATFEAANQAVGTMRLAEEIRDHLLPGWSVETINSTSLGYQTSYRFSEYSPRHEGEEMRFSFFGAILKNSTEGKVIAVGFAGDPFSDYIFGPEDIDRGFTGLSFGVSYVEGKPNSDTDTLAEAINAIRGIGIEDVRREPEARYRYFDTTSRVVLGKRSRQSIKSSEETPTEDQSDFNPESGAILKDYYPVEGMYVGKLRQVMEDGIAAVFELQPNLPVQERNREFTPHIIDVIRQTMSHYASLGAMNDRPYGDIGGQYRAATERGYGNYLSSITSLQEVVTKWWMEGAARIRSLRESRPLIIPSGGGRYHTPPSPTFLGQPIIHIERPFDPDSAD